MNTFLTFFEAIYTRFCMRFRLLFIFFLFVCVQLNAQSLFEEGHYKDFQEITHQGLISIYSVTDSKPYFFFKEKHRSSPDTVYKNTISEIRVSGFKFVRRDVEVLAVDADPINEENFTKKSLLLRVELEGEATLYSGPENSESIFYFSVPNQMTKQLLYSQYLRYDGQIARNNEFRDQLTNIFSCGEIDLSSLKYEKSQLMNIFTQYNECVNSKFETYEGIPPLSSKYLNVGIGFGLSPYFIQSRSNILNREIGYFSDITPYFEIDLEYLIPTLKNRIGFFITSGYLKFSDRDERILLGTSQEIDLHYQVIQSTFGVRGHWLINNNLKLQGEVGLGKDYEIGKGISIDYKIDGRGYTDFNETKLTGHLSGGVGINVFNRYIVEAKFKHFNTKISGLSSEQRVNQSIFTIGFKYLLKSYYK